MLINSVVNWLVGFVVQVQDVIQRWCCKEFSELRQNGEEIEQIRNTRGEPVVEQEVERQDESKLLCIPCLSYVPTDVLYTLVDRT